MVTFISIEILFIGRGRVEICCKHTCQPKAVASHESPHRGRCTAWQPGFVGGPKCSAGVEAAKSVTLSRRSDQVASPSHQGVGEYYQCIRRGGLRHDGRMETYIVESPRRKPVIQLWDVRSVHLSKLNHIQVDGSDMN
jgi:hypothetical protein